jgi:hypothetical protein
MAEVKVNIVGEDLATTTLNTVVENTKNAVSSMNAAFGQLDTSAYEASWGSVLTAIGAALTALGMALKQLDSSLDDVVSEISKVGSELDEIRSRLDEPFKVTIDTEESLEAVRGVIEELLKLDVTRKLSLDVSDAKGAVGSLDADLDSLALAKAFELDVSDALRDAADVKAAIDEIPDVSYKTVVVQYQTQASPLMDFTEGMDYIEERMESLPSEGTYTVHYEGITDHRVANTGNKGASAPGVQQSVSFAPTIQITGTGGKSGRELVGELDRALAQMWRYNRSELRRAMAS